MELKYVCFNITSICNMECPYCYRVGSSYGSVNFEDARKFIDFLVAHNCKTLNITGGEPLLNPYWKEIVRYAFEKNLYIILSTNGLLLNIDDPILFLIKVLSLPLDGCNDEINAKTRGKEHYNIISSLIYKFINGSYPFRLKINTVLTKYNSNNLSEQLSLLNDERIIWKIFQLREKGMFYKFPKESVLSHHEFQVEILKLLELKRKCKIYYMPSECELTAFCGVKPNYFVLNYDGDLFTAKGDADIFLFNIKNVSECMDDMLDINLKSLNNQYQEELYDDFT